MKASDLAIVFTRIALLTGAAILLSVIVSVTFIALSRVV